MCLLSTLVPLSASAHPLKLSASLIQHNSKRKTLQMECKVFIDDFQLSLSNSILKGRDPNTVKRADRAALIEQYFQKYYRVNHNGKALTWKLNAVQPMYRENVLIIQFKEIPIRLRKGSQLSIRNMIMFEDFGSAQTNRTVVRIPSFNIDDGHPSTIRDHSISYTLDTQNK